jgi:hypothetical protein
MGSRIYKKQIKHNMKNIKLFEQYSEDYQTEIEITNSIFEDWLADHEKSIRSLFESDFYDDDEWDSDDSELTSGEKAALARDFQIMSKPQLAALYLRALGKVKDQDSSSYLVMIDGIDGFGQTEEDGKFEITIPALADAIGLDSRTTVSRTVKKFINLITGEGETSGEAIYPKIERAFREFSSRTPREIAVLASEAIQDPMMFTKNRDAAAAEGLRSASKRAEQKKTQIKIGEIVNELIKSLKTTELYRNVVGKAERAAIAKVSRELGIPIERVQLAYSKFLNDKKIN